MTMSGDILVEATAPFSWQQSQIKRLVKFSSVNLIKILSATNPAHTDEDGEYVAVECSPCLVQNQAISSGIVGVDFSAVRRC